MSDDTPSGVDKRADNAPDTGVSDEDAAAHLDELVGDAPEEGGADPASGEPEDPQAARIAELESERNDLKDQFMRALAETENVRKRANRQIEEERVYAVERFARDLLNVSDNLSRALIALPDEARADLSEAGQNLVAGVELTEKELHAVMARHGVAPIDASPGASFDPNLHQAVSQIPSEHPVGSVAQAFQSGWKIGERTLRAAMVAVSAGGAKPSEAAASSEPDGEEDAS